MAKAKKSSKSSGKTGRGMSASRASKVMRSSRSAGKRSAAAKALSLRSPRSNVKNPISKRHAGEDWSAADVKTLRDLEAQNTPTRVIGLKLGRTAAAIYDKAAEIGLSLKPANQPPNKGRATKGRTSKK